MNLCLFRKHAGNASNLNERVHRRFNQADWRGACFGPTPGNTLFRPLARYWADLISAKITAAKPAFNDMMSQHVACSALRSKYHKA
jgi:hypothetical protein